MSPTTLLWLIAGCLMLQPLSTDLYLASLPHLASDFGVTPAAVQDPAGRCARRLALGDEIRVAGPHPRRERLGLEYRPWDCRGSTSDRSSAERMSFENGR